MIWYILVFHVLSFQNLSVPENETRLNFDIILKGKRIGQLQATKTIADSEIYYQSKANLTARFIKEIHVNYSYHVVFNSPNLKEADVYVEVNKKPHAETNTQLVANQYQIKHDNKEPKILKQAINYSTILLFFEEPKNIKYCYSEEEGRMNTIISLGNHTYKKVNARGNENIYYYENGKLIQADIDGGLINFQMIAK